MDKIAWSILVVWLVIFIVPFVIYSGFSIVAGLKPPGEASPLRFLLGIAISKLGVALAFVLILSLAFTIFSASWWNYALIWWLMFVVEEIGQATGMNYSWKEAVAGIISESVYFPLSAFLASMILNG